MHVIDVFNPQVCDSTIMYVSWQVYVAVQFYPWFNFDFRLFFSMLIYDNEYQTKENQN